MMCYSVGKIGNTEGRREEKEKQLCSEPWLPNLEIFKTMSSVCLPIYSFISSLGSYILVQSPIVKWLKIIETYHVSKLVGETKLVLLN